MDDEHTSAGVGYVHLGGKEGAPSNPYIGLIPRCLSPPSTFFSVSWPNLVKSGFRSISVSPEPPPGRSGGNEGGRSCNVVGRSGEGGSTSNSILIPAQVNHRAHLLGPARSLVGCQSLPFRRLFPSFLIFRIEWCPISSLAFSRSKALGVSLPANCA